MPGAAPSSHVCDRGLPRVQDGDLDVYTANGGADDVLYRNDGGPPAKMVFTAVNISSRPPTQWKSTGGAPCLCPATLTSMVPRGLLTAARAWVRAGLCIRALDPGRGAVLLTQNTRWPNTNIESTRLLPEDKKHSQYNPNNRAHTQQGFKYGSFAACQKACDGPGAAQCTGFELRPNLGLHFKFTGDCPSDSCHVGGVECVLYSWPFIGNETVEWRLKPGVPKFNFTLNTKVHPHCHTCKLTDYKTNFTGGRGQYRGSGARSTTFYRTKCTTAPSPIAKDSCGVAMADCWDDNVQKRGLVSELSLQMEFEH